MSATAKAQAVASLQPGDCLLYTRTPFVRSRFGWLCGLVINIKTWNRHCHVEVYDGDGFSLASRDGIGVARYPLRTDELVCIRRPPVHYDHDRAVRWFEQSANGQKYDFLGLLVFTYAIKMGAKDRMFCSEFATRLYRIGGVKVINPDMNADGAAPAQLWQTPILETVWDAG